VVYTHILLNDTFVAGRNAVKMHAHLQTHTLKSPRGFLKIQNEQDYLWFVTNSQYGTLGKRVKKNFMTGRFCTLSLSLSLSRLAIVKMSFGLG